MSRRLRCCHGSQGWPATLIVSGRPCTPRLGGPVRRLSGDGASSVTIALGLEGVGEDVFDVGCGVDGELVTDSLRNIFDLRFFASRQDALGETGPVGGQDLLLHPTDGQ